MVAKKSFWSAKNSSRPSNISTMLPLAMYQSNRRGETAPTASVSAIASNSSPDEMPVVLRMRAGTTADGRTDHRWPRFSFWKCQ